MPGGATIVGDYHTHGDYSTLDVETWTAVRTNDPSKDFFDANNYTKTDITGITNDAKGVSTYRGYLGTPSGKFKAYDPIRKRQYEIY